MGERWTPPPEIDTTVSNPARVYDYLLGGKDNFAVDREVAELMARPRPSGVEIARAGVRIHRAFLGRAVRYLVAEAGIRQFLDIGCGIPTKRNTHEVAQEAVPECRVVYVDHDPVVLAHAHELLRSDPAGQTSFLLGDLREPEGILREAAKTLTFSEPVAILLVGILHFVRDEDDPYGAVATLVEAAPAGSHLTVLHLASDVDEEMTQVVRRHNTAKVADAAVLRSRAEMERFFEGLHLVEPGIVRSDGWRPDEADPRLPDGLKTPSYAGIARKP